MKMVFESDQLSYSGIICFGDQKNSHAKGTLDRESQ